MILWRHDVYIGYVMNNNSRFSKLFPILLINFKIELMYAKY